MNKAKAVINSLEFLVLFMIVLTGHHAFCEEIPGGMSSARVTPVVAAVRQSLPWVVNIGTRQRRQVNDDYDTVFNQFFGSHYASKPNIEYFPLGSGVIVEKSGLILTNYHVVQRAMTIEVRMWNGKSYRAKMIGFDVPNDLCLLQLENNGQKFNFKEAPFAKPNDLMLGETVVTIGNPFGLEHSVSSGVLSAVNRAFFQGEIVFFDIIQTDAMVNPGNSGGPLINLDGNLIGINLAVRTDAQGICFAIPLARIELFLSKWMRPAHFGMGYLGLADEPIAKVGRLGVELPDVMPDGPLAKAGLAKGAEVVAINGRPVECPIDFARAVFGLKPGERVAFAMANGTVKQVIVEKMPAKMLVEIRTGLKLNDLTGEVRHAIGLENTQIAGVIVTEVSPNRFFAVQKQQWRDILKRGDIITAVAGRPVKNLADLQRFLSDSQSGDVVQFEALSFDGTAKNYRSLKFSMVLN